MTKGACVADYKFKNDVEGHLIKLSMQMSSYVGLATDYIVECNNQGPPPPPLLDPLPVAQPRLVLNDPTGPANPWVPPPPPMPEWDPLFEQYPDTEPLLVTTIAAGTAAAIGLWIIRLAPCAL